MEAKKLTEFVLRNFNNSDSELFYYTSHSSSPLITRTTEVSDNVIPASNSQMALNLFYLGIYFEDKNWQNKAVKMLHHLVDELIEYAPGYSNWGCLALNLIFPFKEISIVGKNVEEKLLALYQTGVTNTILAVSATESFLPLTANKFDSQKTLIYVCENNSCKQPVEAISEAVQLIS